MKLVIRILAVVALLAVIGAAAVVILLNTVLSGKTLSTNPGLGQSPVFNQTNPNLWNEPQKQGYMTIDGAINYSQTGKKGEKKVTGNIPEGMSAVCTGYRQDFMGKIVEQGFVEVISGKFSFDANPMIIQDGACTLVSNESVQAKLDSMAVDFARGNKVMNTAGEMFLDENGQEQWSYKPWDLNHLSIGTYNWNGLVLSKTSDTYPNNPPVVDPDDKFAPQASSSSSAAQPTVTAPTTVATHEPENTGVGQTKSFTAGTPVLGFKITIGSKSFKNCFLADPKEAGSLTDGVMWPTATQISTMAACN